MKNENKIKWVVNFKLVWRSWSV